MTKFIKRYFWRILYCLICIVIIIVCFPRFANIIEKREEVLYVMILCVFTLIASTTNYIKQKFHKKEH